MPVVGDFAVSPRGGSGAAPWVTTSANPTLGVKVKLEATYDCPAGTPACVRAVYRLTQGTSTVTLNGAYVTPGSVSPVAVSSALAVGMYSVTMRAESKTTGLVSNWSSAVSLRVDPPPQMPTWVWDTASWPNAPTLPAGTPLTILATANPADADVRQFCASVSKDGQTDEYCSAPSGTPVAGTVSVSVPALTAGTYTVSVSARDEFSTGAPAADIPVQRTASWG